MEKEKKNKEERDIKPVGETHESGVSIKWRKKQYQNATSYIRYFRAMKSRVESRIIELIWRVRAHTNKQTKAMVTM